MTEPEPWRVTCAYCGTEVPGERTRLFWSTDPANPGTFRTCKNDMACQRRAGARAEFLRKRLEDGFTDVSLDEIKHLTRWHERGYAPGELTEIYGS